MRKADLVSLFLAALLIIVFVVCGCSNENISDKNGGETKDTCAGEHNDSEDPGREEVAAGRESNSDEQSSGTIKLTEEQEKTAGIKTEALAYSKIDEKIKITGELEGVLPSRQVKITPLVSGKLLEFKVSEGERVTRGQALATLDSLELAKADADFHAAEAEMKRAQKELARVKEMAKLGIFSKSALEDAKTAYGQARGAMEDAQADVIVAKKQYARVKELEKDGISSHKDLEVAEADLTKALAREKSSRITLAAASDRLKREELSYKKGHLAYKEVNEVQKAYDEASSNYRSALNTFKILGLDDRNHGRSMMVKSPISGIVTSLDATPGEAVEPTTGLLKIVDPSVLWLRAEIHERDLHRVGSGQKVTFTVDAYQNETFYGHIAYISPSIDDATRTIKARVEVANKMGRLKIHMFAKGFISASDGKKALLVPNDAVQLLDNKHIVFVQERPGEYCSRTITTGGTYDNVTEITGGVSPGSLVVTKGSFVLKSEAKKASFESG